MKRWLILTALLAILAGTAAAEGWDERWGLGLEGGIWKQKGGDRDYSNVDQFTSLKLRYGLAAAWSLDLSFKYGWFRPGVDQPGQDAGFTFDSGAGLYTRTWQPSLSGTYRFITGGTWRPWGSVGAGITRWDVRDLRNGESPGLWPDGIGMEVYDNDGNLVSGHGVNFTAILGLGTEIVVGDNWSFDVGIRYDFLLGQNTDSVGMSSPTMWGADHVDANTGIVEGMLGVNYWFGSSDSDGDGIPNARDGAPDDPEDIDGYRDEDGVPDPDNDNDGILDVDDQAPLDPEDHDGFQDEDGVPDPDNDGDGIYDADDQCPDEAEDIDGFQDDDGCPDPDNDGDGVLDADDQCDGTPAGVPVDPHGCPVVAEISADLVLAGVTFKLGSAELTSDSLTHLDQVTESLLAWPEATVEVGGHTDSSGSAELNRDISRQRAESVRQYLLLRGIDDTRVTAVGYGEDYPIADNATKEGRATNRRVELKRTDR